MCQATASTDQLDKGYPERTATDHQIDRLVYTLYGLTDADLALVEGEKR